MCIRCTAMSSTNVHEIRERFALCGGRGYLGPVAPVLVYTTHRTRGAAVRGRKSYCAVRENEDFATRKDAGQLYRGSSEFR